MHEIPSAAETPAVEEARVMEKNMGMCCRKFMEIHGNGIEQVSKWM